MQTAFDVIRERELRERRRAAIYGTLLVGVAVLVFGAIFWTYG